MENPNEAEKKNLIPIYEIRRAYCTRAIKNLSANKMLSKWQMLKMLSKWEMRELHYSQVLNLLYSPLRLY